jgi:hypothetical protein
MIHMSGDRPYMVSCTVWCSNQVDALRIGASITADPDSVSVLPLAMPVRKSEDDAQ